MCDSHNCRFLAVAQLESDVLVSPGVELVNEEQLVWRPVSGVKIIILNEIKVLPVHHGK